MVSEWEVTIPAFSTKWAHSRYSSVSPLSLEPGLDYARDLRFGSLCGWEASFADSENPFLSFGVGRPETSPPPTSSHALCTPSPAWFTAWVAGASHGLPCGSPVMTLITQVSGRQGEVRAPGAAFSWHPASSPWALPHPL